MRELRTAEIIAVGSELLTPFRSDTNSLYLTARLNELGVDVRVKSIVGDDRAEMAGLVRQALSRADIVVLTGGLGPTDDDVTREVVAEVLQRPLDDDPEIFAAIEARFASRGVRMPAINRRQAQVPRGAVPLANPRGTAPGLWIEAGDQAVVLLPGPPRELQPMFEALMADRLAARTGNRRTHRRVIRIAGRAESQVDEVAQPIYAPMRDWPIPIQTTILAASPGQIELHLSGAGASDDVERALDAAAAQLANALAPAVFSTDGRSLEEVVGALLLARRWRIAVAESCTAGLVLARLTEVPGSSAWVTGGIVAYDNQVKVEQLGVPQSLLDEHGAVSEPVGAAMAEGVRSNLHADIGVAVTGIAGPGGGTDAKPVGTVVTAVAGPTSLVKTSRFPGDRRMVRSFATQTALELVRQSFAG